MTCTIFEIPQIQKYSGTRLVRHLAYNVIHSVVPTILCLA